MNAPLTVVIPTLNAAESLPGSVESLYEGLFGGVIRELIVSDGGSADQTVEIAKALGANVIAGPPSRGAQLRRGTEAAKADWILVLHADTHLAPGWSEAVTRHIAEAPETAGYFWLRFDARGVAPAWVARWANLRARAFALPYGDQGLLIPAKLLADIGGYPDQPLMEDVSLCLSLRGRLRPLDHIAVTAADRYLAEGWVRRGSRNLFCLARYLAGADPERLAAAYRKRG